MTCRQPGEGIPDTKMVPLGNHAKPANAWHSTLRFDRKTPDKTFDALRECAVGIKGPLETPVGGGIRSLNVTLRQVLDLYVCLRPVRWYEGVPSPLKDPQKVDVVIFRENTEDVYAGIEYK